MLLIGLVGGGGDDDETSTSDGSDREPEPTTTEAPQLPAFEVSPRGDRELVVLTDEVDPDVLRAIFNRVRDDYRDEGDSWLVVINCASIPSTEAFDPRTANGKFANTTEGLAQTGLASTEEVEFGVTGLESCVPPNTTTTEPPPDTAPPTTAAPTAPPTTTVAFYASCADAEAAGATPLRRGDPGYSADLDRDGDGVACES